jgi:hypothetical protein
LVHVVAWLTVASLAMLLLNLCVSAEEIRRDRQVAPQRVIQDEMLLHPERFPKPAVPRSPWDD